MLAKEWLIRLAGDAGVSIALLWVADVACK